MFFSDFAEMLAADDGDRNTVAPIYELQLVYDHPNDSPDAGLSRWRMFDLVAVTYTNRGGNPGIQRLPGTANSTAAGKTDINGVPYGRGRVDLRLALGGDGEIYVISKSDGMIRRMTAALSPPNVQSITNSGSNVTIAWRSVPGWNYRVQYKTNLAEVDWQDLPGDVTATGLTSTKTTAQSDNRFFRIKRIQP